MVLDGEIVVKCVVFLEVDEAEEKTKGFEVWPKPRVARV